MKSLGWLTGRSWRKIQALVRYWGTGYDWRKAEAKLNALPQFTTNIDGLDIQFIHVRSRHKNALPVIRAAFKSLRPADGKVAAR